MERIGLLGAGFIATYHAKALQGKVQAVCDSNKTRAESLAKEFQIPKIYDALDSMLSDKDIDTIHILLPPDLHFSTAKASLEAGKHLFLEKPMALSEEECAKLNKLAKQKNLRLGVNHNFLFYPIYEQFKTAFQGGQLGEIDHLTITWHRELEQLHAGSLNKWMVQDPKNIITEIGPHLAAFVYDLLGSMEPFTVDVSGRIELPCGTPFFRRWMVLGHHKDTCIEMRLALSPGFEDVSIEARGSLGKARVDFGRNRYTLTRPTKYSIDIDRYLTSRREGKSIQKQAWKTFRDYALAKFGFATSPNPYFTSIKNSIHTFYEGPDSRHSSELGGKVISLCCEIAEKASLPPPQRETPPPRKKQADILLLGGTGFIGKTLINQLVKQGSRVRAFVRSANKIPYALTDKIDIIEGNLENTSDLSKAMQGISSVYHLARAHVNTWEEYQMHEIAVTKQIAECCLKADIEHLFYTGTIDSYYGGSRGKIITEETPLDPKIHLRNYYAQAKAHSERLLMKMHKEQNLPVTIFRPGIVIGKDGSPFHWGVGFWSPQGAVCRIWGEGTNPLPFILVEDVASALANALHAKNLEGESFNLIGKPCLSAKDYIQALQSAMQIQIDAVPTPIWKFFGADLTKFLIKLLVNHPNKRLPSYRDWKSRTQLSTYDCTKAKEQLNWNPVDSQKLVWFKAE